MQDNARKLTYGAMMIALFAVLFAVSLFIPLLGSVTLFFIPLPIMLYRLRYDRSASLLVAVAAVLISALLGGFLSIPAALTLVVIGFVMGEAVRAGKSKFYTVMAAGTALLLSIVATYVGGVLFFQFNAIDAMMDMFQQAQQRMTDFMSDMGTLPEDAQKTIDDTFQYYRSTIPAMVMLSSLFGGYLFVAANFYTAGRVGADVQKFPPFREMKLPFATIVVYAAVVLLSFFLGKDTTSTGYLIYMNAILILRFAFLLQGLSLIYYFLHERKTPRAVTVIATIFALMLNPMTILLGTLDTAINIRAWIGNDKVN
ncbi:MULTISPECIES: YybS family protein [Sporosarcina]|uniref:YybS family protein n=1 Tax=Sporosarcina TaxID=1569 RepID=UPI00058C1CD8|nr:MULTISPECIES: YybS family protein [Sporosarcina]WJY26800.1 YybS family protein [Sporosarcina sp. 0.2-SM1T-5]